MPEQRRGKAAPIIAVAIATVVAAVFVVLAQAGDDDRQTARTPLLDRPAPEAVGELDGGGTFDLARRKGSWVVLNFFASNCIPCQQEHPELVKFAESDPRGELITIVNGDTRRNVRAFFDENGGGWPVVFDDDGSIATAFGVTLVPETWLIDPGGVVRWRTISTVTAEQLDDLISTASGAS